MAFGFREQPVSSFPPNTRKQQGLVRDKQVRSPTG